jgi:hypothetical protein
MSTSLTTHWHTICTEQQPVSISNGAAVPQHAIAQSAHAESVLLQKHAHTVLNTTASAASATGTSSSNSHMITLREGQPLQELLSAVQAAVASASSSNNNTSMTNGSSSSGAVVSAIEWLPDERAVKLQLR